MGENELIESRFEQKLLRLLGGTLLSIAEAMGRIVHLAVGLEPGETSA